MSVASARAQEAERPKSQPKAETRQGLRIEPSITAVYDDNVYRVDSRTADPVADVIITPAIEPAQAFGTGAHHGARERLDDQRGVRRSDVHASDRERATTVSGHGRACAADVRGGCRWMSTSCS